MDAPGDGILSVWLDREIEIAAGEMSNTSGGASACTLHKDGRVIGGFKYHEGRLIALAEMRRFLRRGGLDTQDLDAIEQRWRVLLEQHRSSGVSSTMWVAYATGGLGAIRETISRVSRTPQ